MSEERINLSARCASPLRDAEDERTAALAEARGDRLWPEGIRAGGRP